MSLNEELKKSEHIIAIPLSDDKVFAYHKLHKNPLIIDNNTFDFLDLFCNWTTPDKLKEEFNISELEDVVTIFENNKFLNKKGYDERSEFKRIKEQMLEHLSEADQFPGIGFTTGTACNFACTYCMSIRMAEVSNIAGGYKESFSFEIAKKIIDDYLTSCIDNEMKETFIGFSGGEPLLYWDNIKKIIEYTSLSTPYLGQANKLICAAYQTVNSYN